MSLKAELLEIDEEISLATFRLPLLLFLHDQGLDPKLGNQSSSNWPQVPHLLSNMSDITFSWHSDLRALGLWPGVLGSP